MPTGRQEAVARILADNPRITKTEAVIRAGYSAKFAGRNVTVVTRSDGVQEALAKIREERADTARELKRASASKIAKRIEDDSASDALLVSTFKTAHDIAAEEPEEAIVSLGAARARLRRALYRAWTAGKRAGLDGGGESHSAELTRE